MTDFFRFPHTPHIAWLATGAPRDDKVLSPDEAHELLSDLVTRSSLIALMYQSSHSAEHSQDEHVAIVDALERRDARAAARLMPARLRNSHRHAPEPVRQAVLQRKSAISETRSSPLASPKDTSRRRLAGSGKSGQAPDHSPARRSSVLMTGAADSAKRCQSSPQTSRSSRLRSDCRA